VTSPFWILLSIWAVDFLALVSPGPNFLLVTQTAMQRDRRRALIVALGVASGSALWGSAVALGLSALFAAVPWLSAFVRIAGAAYLVHLGIGLWRAGATDPPEGKAVPESSAARAYLRGLLTNLLNPKSAAYYGSVFALFFPPGTPGWLPVCAIALITASSALWHVAVALLFSTTRVHRAYRALRGTVNRIAGAVMTGFGLRLLLAPE
jgi:threonine efflux protein